MKNNVLDAIKFYCPKFKGINEQPIVNRQNITVGWHSYCYLDDGSIISGGSSTSKDKARRIAIAELLERSVAQSIQKNTDIYFDLLINEFPSTSGFAAGFDGNATKTRAIFEGVERWAWSSWIDQQNKINMIDIDHGKLSALDLHLVNLFDHIEFFQKEIKLFLNNIIYNLVFHVSIGYLNGGAFPGSKVTRLENQGWSHCLIESQRNLNNFKLLELKKIEDTDWLTSRVMYFGQNSKIAKDIISSCDKNNWSIGEIRVLKQVPLKFSEIFVWRCLLKNFTPWHLGTKKRFVY